jgi:hypothetical protein
MSPQNNPQLSTIDDVPKRVTLLNGLNHCSVAAVCTRLTRTIARDKIDRIWWNETEWTKALRKAEPDVTWKWVKLLGDVISQEGKYTNGWVVETPADTQVQGAIIYSTNAVSLLEKGPSGEPIPAVYVQFLATAPRNRDRLTRPQPGNYRGVGTALLRIAIAHSYLIGGGGSINLASVHHPDTIAWYEDFGFLHMEAETEGRLVFELPRDVAARHLSEMGLP